MICYAFSIYFFCINGLHQMTNQLFLVTTKHVNDRNFNHRISTWLLLQGSTSHIHQYLSRQSWVVNLHIKLKQLVMRLA